MKSEKNTYNKKPNFQFQKEDKREILSPNNKFIHQMQEHNLEGFPSLPHKSISKTTTLFNRKGQQILINCALHLSRYKNSTRVSNYTKNY